MSKKRHSKFKIFLAIYAVVLVAAVAVVCSIVWKRLAAYQASYEEAKAGADPAICVEEFVTNLNYDSILNYIERYGLNTKGPHDMNIAHAKYFADMLVLNKAEYFKNDQYTNSTPVYDIVAGDKRIAVVSLKSAGKNDDFGFHKWQIKNMAFDTNMIEYRDVTIKVPAGSSVDYNGYVLTEEELVDTTEHKDRAIDAVTSAGGTAQFIDKYVVKNILGDVILQVITPEGEVLNCEEQDGVYDYAAVQYGERLAEVTERVFKIATAYIMNIYRQKSFSEISGYLEAKSKAYAIIKEVQSAIAWSWKPSRVDVLEQTVTDAIFYSEKLFSCSYYGKIYKFKKEGAAENGEEEFRYRMMFKKVSDKWVLSYFVLEN